MKNSPTAHGTKYHSQGFVIEGAIKWLLIVGGVLLAGYGLFKYQMSLYDEISGLKTANATLVESVKEKDKDIQLLKDLRKSDEEALKTLQATKDKVHETIKYIYLDKGTKIDKIEKDETLTPLQKTDEISMIQIDSLWQAYCSLVDNTEPVCSTLPPPTPPAVVPVDKPQDKEKKDSP